MQNEIVYWTFLTKIEKSMSLSPKHGKMSRFLFKWKLRFSIKPLRILCSLLCGLPKMIETYFLTIFFFQDFMTTPTSVKILKRNRSFSRTRDKDSNKDDENSTRYNYDFWTFSFEKSIKFCWIRNWIALTLKDFMIWLEVHELLIFSTEVLKRKKKVFATVLNLRKSFPEVNIIKVIRNLMKNLFPSRGLNRLRHLSRGQNPAKTAEARPTGNIITFFSSSVPLSICNCFSTSKAKVEVFCRKVNLVILLSVSRSDKNKYFIR